MGATFGLAVALSRSRPARPETASRRRPDRRAAGIPRARRRSRSAATSPRSPPTCCGWSSRPPAGLYLAGVVRLRRRGDRWPVERTLFWMLGSLALVYVTSGGPGVYGRLGFSPHMVQHMALMVVPPFLLVLRGTGDAGAARPARPQDRSSARGRRCCAWSTPRSLAFLGNPVVAAALFTGGLTVFYYTALFSLALLDPHRPRADDGALPARPATCSSGSWSGSTRARRAAVPVPARDPAGHARLPRLLRHRPDVPARPLLGPQWWAALGRTDTAALIADQQRGGGDRLGRRRPALVLLGVVLLLDWVRTDRSEPSGSTARPTATTTPSSQAYNARLASIDPGTQAVAGPERCTGRPGPARRAAGRRFAPPGDGRPPLRRRHAPGTGGARRGRVPPRPGRAPADPAPPAAAPSSWRPWSRSRCCCTSCSTPPRPPSRAAAPRSRRRTTP